jgi:DNA-binding MarR family transcriptional regulator
VYGNPAMDETARQAALADLYAQPGHLLWRAAARVSRLVDEILPGRADIHAYAALLGLADEEPQSQQSLARMVGVSGTTMTSVAETLLRDELVVRVRNPEDRRSYSLTRTTAGRSAVRGWAPHVVRLEERLTASFTREDAVRLKELLTQVAGDVLDDRTPEALRNSTGFLVTRAHFRAHREFLAGLAPIGIEPRHYGSMRVLRSIDPVTQGQLASLLDVSPATVVQMVDNLEAAGLVSRERDSADRRAYRLHLTPLGSRTAERATEIAGVIHSGWLGGPRSRQRTDLVRLLTLLLSDAAEA